MSSSDCHAVSTSRKVRCWCYAFTAATMTIGRGCIDGDVRCIPRSRRRVPRLHVSVASERRRLTPDQPADHQVAWTTSQAPGARQAQPETHAGQRTSRLPGWPRSIWSSRQRKAATATSESRFPHRHNIEATETNPRQPIRVDLEPTTNAAIISRLGLKRKTLETPHAKHNSKRARLAKTRPKIREDKFRARVPSSRSSLSGRSSESKKLRS